MTPSDPAFVVAALYRFTAMPDFESYILEVASNNTAGDKITNLLILLIIFLLVQPLTAGY